MGKSYLYLIRKNYKYVVAGFAVLLILSVGVLFATSVRGAGQNAITGQAEVLNTGGYINFGESPYNSNIALSDPDDDNDNIRVFSGYAWSDDLGWLDFGDAEHGGPVTVDYETGEVTGRAYAINTGGFIDFSGDDFFANTQISLSTGTFVGYAWSSDLGWIDFNNSQVSVVDVVPPNNPQSVTGYRDNQLMVELVSAEGEDEEKWYNSQSPYFSWDESLDPTGDSGYSSGIGGYYVYFGTDPNAIPSQLGTVVTVPNYTPSGLTSGQTYYLRIQAFDNNGNIYTGNLDTYHYFTYRYDGDEPINPKYISLPASFVSNREVTFTWPTSGPDMPKDNLSGLLGIQYRIGDGNPWYGSLHLPPNGDEVNMEDVLAPTGSYTLHPVYDQPLLVQGSNIIYIRSIDKAGNVASTYTTGVLKLNTDAPSSPRSLTVNPTNNITNSYSFSWLPPDTYVGNESQIQYCYTIEVLPSASSCNYTAPGQLSLSAGPYAVQPGTNILYLVARDEAYNINYETYISVNYTYNGSAPGIPTDFDIADISIKANSNWRLAISWDEPQDLGAGVEKYKIFRSTKENASCSNKIDDFEEIGTTTGLAYIDTGLEQRTYYYCVQACDSANNCGAVSSTDNKYPDGKYTEPPALVSGPSIEKITTTRAVITWYTDRLSDTKIQYGLKSGAYFKTEAYQSDPIKAHSLTLEGLSPDTTYFYRAKWTDEDGNTGVSEEKVFKTDPAPVVNEVNVTYVDTSSAIIRFKIKDSTMAKIYYGRSEGFGGFEELSTSYSESAYSVPLRNLEDGSRYYYKINPVDIEGQEYNGTVLSFETLPFPKISNITVQELKGALDPTIVLNWFTNTHVTSIVSFYPVSDQTKIRDNVNLEMIQGEHEMMIRGLVPDTDYILTIQGNDRFNNRTMSEDIRFTTATDNRPPEISNIVIEENIENFQELNKSPRGQIIMYWETDELAKSQVEYGEVASGGFKYSTLLNDILSFKHIVVINDLELSTAYQLRAKSIDEAGNVATSKDQLAVTPKSKGSIVDILITTLTDVFTFL